MTAEEWLQSVRKLDAALTQHHGVKGTNHPQMGASVAFPYRRGGETYAAKFRKLDGKDWRSTQGVTRGLFNADALSALDGPAVITEGEIDALSCVQAGFPRTVSLPDGWGEGEGKRKCLLDAEESLRKAPFVIVAGDADEAGQSLPRAVANILRGHDVRFVRWPDGCKDANDVLVQFGEGELARCLTAAKQLDPEGGFITGISDLPPMPARRVLRVGMPPFDYFLAFEVGAMSVGTGVPGSGKSTFTTFAAYHVAREEDVRVGFLSFETHPYRTRDHLCRLSCGLPWDSLSGHQQREVAETLDRYFRIVHRTFERAEAAHNLGWLQDMIYTLAVRDGCKLIIVDPWNELEHMPQPGESMTGYINFALQQIRTWAEQYDCHICLIAHPRKMPTDRPDVTPTGYDIADSAAFANKPSLGFTIHQVERTDKDTGEEEKFVRAKVWKVRDTQLYGFEKSANMLTFEPERMSYRKYEKDRFK